LRFPDAQGSIVGEPGVDTHIAPAQAPLSRE
jgi:hypothetical protein